MSLCEAAVKKYMDELHQDNKDQRREITALKSELSTAALLSTASGNDDIKNALKESMTPEAVAITAFILRKAWRNGDIPNDEINSQISWLADAMADLVGTIHGKDGWTNVDRIANDYNL